MTPETAYAEVDALAEWSPWVSLSTADYRVVRQPGVYMMRDARDGLIVYVGLARERSGNGLRGRLDKYRGLSSGFGEAVLAQALADADFLRARLDEVIDGNPLGVRDWMRAAIEFARIEVRWTFTPDGDAAERLEDHVLAMLTEHGLWNRKGPRR